MCPAPCPPETVDTDVDCATGVVRVTWEPSVAGVTYTAVALENCTDGQMFMCNATDTSCDLPTLSCGKEYNVTVVPISRDYCVGEYYPIQHIRTGQKKHTHSHICMVNVQYKLIHICKTSAETNCW